MSPKASTWQWGALVSASLLLSGCSTLGPDYQRPEVSEVKSWQAEPINALKSKKTENLSRWWEQFNDPVLTQLVDEALMKNSNIKIAGLKILEARAQLGIAESLLWPQVQQASGQALRVGKESDGRSTTANSYGANFNLGWELDFWGRFERGIEAADANYFATVANYDDMQLLMAAQTAQTYISIRTIEARLQIAHHNAELQKRSLEITERLFKSGNDAELDLQQARTQYLSTISSIPQLETSLHQAQNALGLLLGRAPGALPEMSGNTGLIPQGELALIADVPADLLRRRPDIRETEQLLAAQSALIGISEAELYPHIALAGSVGINSNSLENSNSALTWGAGPAVTWNLFDHGTLSNQILVQDARFLQLHERYKDAVLGAVREVDDAAIAYANGKREIDLLVQTGEAAERSLEIANIQYREGMADFQRVLDSQRALFNQQERLVNSRGSQMQQLIALYKAMGGGWEGGRSRPLVDSETEAKLRERSDWHPYLEAALPTATP